MSNATFAIIVLAVIVVVLVVALLATAARRKRRTTMLRERFGPEYERTAEGEKRRDAERELQERIDLRDKSRIHPLSATARDRFAAQWRDTQTRFVDEPVVAVQNADAIVTAVLRERGYPVDDWDRQTAVVSVDEPEVVDDYRRAHDTLVASRAGRSSTEDLRTGFLRYRTLFDALVEETVEASETGANTP